jgi:hypothetical protein
MRRLLAFLDPLIRFTPLVAEPHDHPAALKAEVSM